MELDFLTKHEQETGFVAVDPKKLPEFKSNDEYLDYVGENRGEFLQVLLDQRVPFLQNNGYKINRKNLLNAELGDRITADPDPTAALTDELRAMDEASKNDSAPADTPEQ